MKTLTVCQRWVILINGFHVGEQNRFRCYARDAIGNFILFRGDVSDVNADGVVDKESALNVSQCAASLGGLAGLYEP